MPVGQKMMKVILGVVIAGMLLGYVFPVGMSAVNEDPTYNKTLEEGTETEIQAQLNATATSIDPTEDQITLEVKDTETGTTESQTISNGSTVQYTTLEGGWVNATVNSVDSGTPNTTDVEFEVEQGYAWDDSSQSIFSILGIFLILVPLIVLAKEAMEA